MKRGVRDSGDTNFPSLFTKCKDIRCMFYKIAIIDGKYKTKNGTILARNCNMTCKTQDLVYVLVCKNCRHEYIVETGLAISERTNLHRNQIIHVRYRVLNVSKHIHNCSNDEFLIFPFFKCNKQCHQYREEQERKFRDLVNLSMKLF